MITAQDLRDFEEEVAAAFDAGEIHGPVHLSGGNEDQIIELFKAVDPLDWVFSTWRSHYHALLHGVPRARVMAEIMAGRSMMLHSPAHSFITSAIVGGILPIAVGVAAGIKARGSPERVWCFVGDMTATTGAFHEAHQYAYGRNLPLHFVIEDNGLSTNTPTEQCWGEIVTIRDNTITRYRYERTYPHYQPLPSQRGF